MPTWTKVYLTWDAIRQVRKRCWRKTLSLRSGPRENTIIPFQVELKIPNNKARIKDEIGDLLFSTAQLARHLDIDPEEALREANLKFIGRFLKLEKIIKDDQKDMMKMDVPELEEYWEKAKKL